MGFWDGKEVVGLRGETGLSLAGQVWRQWLPGNLGERSTEQRGTEAIGWADCVWTSLSLWASPMLSRQWAWRRRWVGLWKI